MRKKKEGKEKKYPENDRDMEVYNIYWEAGPHHYDYKNKNSFDNRSKNL